MRFTLSKISLAILMASALPSQAQTQVDSESLTTTKVEKIAVTGSRIQRSSAATPVPTTVIDAEQIAQLGFVNAGDILNALPAISGSLGARSGTDGLNDSTAGLELANLRGLGTTRTLVLVNGRRHVGSSVGNTAVDISSIPTQMIDRVELITGAAGAVYGADAVSGVVNFIMKKSYDGFKAELRNGITAKSDGQEVGLSLLSGTSFAKNRGNVMVSFDYNQRKGIHSLDRSWSNTEMAWLNNEAYAPGNGEPQKRIGYNIGFSPLNIGGIVSLNGFTYLPDSDGNGTPGLGYEAIGDLPAQTFLADGTMRAVTVCNRFDVTCENDDSFKTRDYDLLSTPTTRAIFSVVSQFELNDSHTLFGDFKYADTKGENISQPSMSDGYYGPLFEVKSGNPFLPEIIQNEMTEHNIERVFVNKAHADLGKLPTKNTHKLLQLVVGSYGDLTSDISYEFSAQYGQNKVVQQQMDNVTANFIQAMDAVVDSNGNIACADTSNGCAPLNPFGVNAASDEAIAFIMRPTAMHGELQQTVVNFSINGDLTDLPAGAVQFATGVEYRREKSSSRPDDILIPGGLTHTTYAGGKVGVAGQYDVTEVFSEVLIPLLSHEPLVEDLTLEAAVRYSDYSTVGGQTAYKLGLNWTLTDEMRVRYSHGLAVRAPNVGELYQAASTDMLKIQDPCSASFIGQGSALRAQNCASLGIPEGWQAFSEAGEVPVKVSGNDALNVEESTTNTIGLVYTPQWIDGFSIALDYWKIQIDDAISAPSRNEVLANCVDFAMTDNPFCELFDRNSDDHEITEVRNKKVNVAALTAKGYDLEMNYQWDLKGAGRVLFNVVASHYAQRDQLLNAQRPDEVLQGINIYNNPKTRGYFSTTYSEENWNAHLAFNYIGSSQIAEITSGVRVYPENHIDSVVYANFRGAYRYDDNIEFFAGINNLMNKGPQKDRPRMATGSSIYDAIGRTFYLGANYEF